MEKNKADYKFTISEVLDQYGNSLKSLSNTKPLLVVFLRHLGCTFCREAVADIAKMRYGIEAEAQIAFVHMGSEAQAKPFFASYDLEDVSRFSDPTKQLYEAFNLHRGSIIQLFGPAALLQGLRSLKAGHGQGKLMGDGMQMPGIFLLNDGKIVKSFIHANAGDRPDYMGMATCELLASTG
ncbi:MAG: SelL-related redox protein [Chthonomonadales bacterium]